MLWAYRQRFWVLMLAFGLLPLWMLVASQRFRLLVDQRQMLSPQANSRQQWLEFAKEFDYRDDFMVIVQDAGFADSTAAPAFGPGSPSQKAMQELGRRVLADRHFESVFYQVQAPVLLRSALFMLYPADLKKIRSMLVEARPWLDKISASDGVQQLLDFLANESPRELARQVSPALGLLDKLIHALSHNIETTGEAPYVSPFPDAQPDAEWFQNQKVYRGQTIIPYMLADGKTYVLLARPARDETVTGPLPAADYRASLAALRKLHDYVNSAQLNYPNVNFYLTGEADLQTAEIHEVLEDVAKYGTLGAVLIAIFLLALLRSPRVLGCLIVTNALAGCWLIGMDSLLGPMNILTSQHWFFAALASSWWTLLQCIEFLVNLQVCANPEAAWAATSPIRHRFSWFLCVTFLFWVSMAALGGGSLRELANYCCVGFFVLALEMLFLLPAVVGMFYAGAPPVYLSRGAWIRVPIRLIRGLIAEASHSMPSRALKVVFLFCLLGLPRVTWDSDLLNLPSRSVEVKQVEQVLEPLGYSTLYAFSVAGNVEEAERMQRKFLALPTVARAESIAMIIPRGMPAKQKTVEEIVKVARTIPLPAQPETLQAEQLLQLYDTYQKAFPRMMTALSELSGPRSDEKSEARDLSAAMADLKSRLALNNPGPVRDGLTAYERALTNDTSSLLKFLDEQKTEVPNLLAELPLALKLRAVSKSGLISIRIFPKLYSWRFSQLQRFVEDLRTVDPNVTGTPPLLLDFLHGIRNGMTRGLTLFLGVGFGLFLVWPRRVADSPCGWGPLRLAFPVLGALWSLGLAGLLGYDLNALSLWYWILSVHLGWLYCLAASCTDQDTCDGPFLLALIALTVSALFLMASNLGVRSCAEMLTVGIVCQILTSLTWPTHYWGEASGSRREGAGSPSDSYPLPRNECG